MHSVKGDKFFPKGEGIVLPHDFWSQEKIKKPDKNKVTGNRSRKYTLRFGGVFHVAEVK